MNKFENAEELAKRIYNVRKENNLLEVKDYSEELAKANKEVRDELNKLGNEFIYERLKVLAELHDNLGIRYSIIYKKSRQNGSLPTATDLPVCCFTTIECDTLDDEAVKSGKRLPLKNELKEHNEFMLKLFKKDMQICEVAIGVKIDGKEFENTEFGTIEEVSYYA